MTIQKTSLQRNEPFMTKLLSRLKKLMSDDERQEQLKAAEEAYGAFEKRLAEQRSKSDGGNNGD
jgi:hypothetical protein